MVTISIFHSKQILLISFQIHNFKSFFFKRGPQSVTVSHCMNLDSSLGQNKMLILFTFAINQPRILCPGLMA